MGKIALTGATGRLGSLVVHYLLDKGYPANDITVIIRNHEKAGEFTRLGLEVRFGDYDDHESLRQAFHNLQRFLFISSPSADDTHRIRQHANVVEALRDAEVEHIIYTSLAFCEQMTIGLEHVHLATEHLIQTTSIPFTFLRNGFYMDTVINSSLLDAVEAGELITSTNNGKMNVVMRSDLALAAAHVLIEGKKHENQVYELANPILFSYNDLAKSLSAHFGRTVHHRNVLPEEAYKQMIAAGASEEAADFIVYRFYDSIAKGEFNHSSRDLEMLIGQKPASFNDAVKKLAAEYKQ